MALDILFDTDVGAGLEKTSDGKLAVKAGENVTVGPEGVSVKFPEAKRAVATVAVDTDKNELVLTFTDGTEERKALPPLPIDVRLQGAEVIGNMLRLTLSDGTVLPDIDLSKFMDFTPEAVLNAIKNFSPAQKAEFKTALLELLKGEEVKNFGGTETKGFLLVTA